MVFVSKVDHPCRHCPNATSAQGNVFVHGLQTCDDCLQELRARLCTATASAEASTSPFASSSSSQDPAASEGPATTEKGAGEVESRSQKCKSHPVEIDLEDLEDDWRAAGQLVQQACHQCLCCFA